MHILLILFIFINQVRIDLEILDIKVGTKDADLLFAQVKAFAKVQGNRSFHNFFILV